MNKTHLLCLMAALLGVADVPAADSELPAKPITLAEAVALALEQSPALASQPAALRLADARSVQARVRPPMQLDLDLEDIVGTDQYANFRFAQNTLTLSRVFELGGKRDTRGGVAGAERARTEATYALARAEVLASVTDAFIHLVGDQHGLAWSREAVRLAEESLATAQQRILRAAASGLDEKRARIALARARILEEHEEHELETARRRLAATWGADEATFGTATADLFARPRVPEFEELVARIGSSPEVARWASERAVYAAELRVASSRRRPDLTAGVGLRQYSATDDIGLVLQFSIPLGTSSRASGLADEAGARSELAEANRRETEVRLRTALFGIAQELRHARTELDALEGEILPEAEGALALARDGVASARLSQVDLLDAQRTVLELQRERIDAAVVFHQLVAQLEKVLGEPLVLDTESPKPGPRSSP